jgi:arabinose-5-phosphate isomerase
MNGSQYKILSSAKKTIELEAKAIGELTGWLNNDFENALKAIHEGEGRLVVTGIGKSAIVAQKIVSTLNSTGTPSLFLHAADAIHGDIGMVQKSDIVLIISKSGDSPEIKVLVPLIKNFGNTLIAMTSNEDGLLATRADFLLHTGVSEEACPNNLAPTTSTTAQIVLGDALAICLMEMRGFSSDDFAKFHPGGTLGKKLYLRVSELCVHNAKPLVKATDILKQVIIEITQNRLGATVVVNEKNRIIGIITDGDLRRMLENLGYSESIQAQDIMSGNPKTIAGEELAVNALDLMRRNNITQLIVTSNDEYAGIIHLHDLVKEGII